MSPEEITLLATEPTYPLSSNCIVILASKRTCLCRVVAEKGSTTLHYVCLGISV